MGLGHMYRIFSLIEMTINHFEVLFVTRKTSVLSIIPKEFNYLTIPQNISNEDEPKWLLNKFPTEDNILIFDGYNFDSNYQKKIKVLGYTLIYVDDFAKEIMFADLVINHSLNILESNYKQSTGNVKFALGNKYALLRSSFLRLTKAERNINNINNVFVCFGGADPSNLTVKIVSALLKFDDFLKINVVIGGANTNLEVFNLEKKNSSRLKIYENLNQDQLINVMKNSHLGIVPSSTVLYELCCVRMLIMSGYFVDNQKNIYEGFLKKEAIYGLGDISRFKEDDFIKHIKIMLKKVNIINQMNNQKGLFDAAIPKRYVQLITELC